MKKISAAITALIASINCNAQILLLDDYLAIHAFALMNEVTSIHCNKLYPEHSKVTDQARIQYLSSKKMQLEVAAKIIDVAKLRGIDTSKLNTTEISKELMLLLDDSNKSKSKEFCNLLLNKTLFEASLSPAQYSKREFENKKKQVEIKFGECNNQLQSNVARVAVRFLAIVETPNGISSFPRYETDPLLIWEVQNIQKSVSACSNINKEAIHRKIPFEPNFASANALADSLIEATEFNKEKTVRAVEAARFFLKSRESANPSQSDSLTAPNSTGVSRP
jgi:hypothetical protein